MEHKQPSNSPDGISPHGIALLDLGRAIQSNGDHYPSRPSDSQSQNAVFAAEADVIAGLKAVKDARKIIAFRDGEPDVMEVRVLAVAIYMGLMLDYHPNVRSISELVGKELPSEVMAARAAMRRMCERQVIRFRNGMEKPWNGIVSLTSKTLVFLGLGTPRSCVFTEKTLGNTTGQQYEENAVERDASKGHIPTTEALCTRIRKTVIGAYIEGPIRTIAAMFVTHLHRARMIADKRHPGTPNLVGLVIGSSAAGKTFVTESAAKCANSVCGANAIPFASFSATDLTAGGYVGCQVDDCVRPLLDRCRGDVAKARFGCILLDEMDKKACRTTRTALDVGGRGVQEELLRILGGAAFPVGGRRNTQDRQVEFNSDGTMFMLAGAFVGLAELMGKQTQGRIGFGAGSAGGEKARLRDCLVDYGLIPELVSRIGSIIVVRDPGVDDLIDICTAPSGLISCYRRLWQGMGISVTVTAAGIRDMAEYGIDTRSFARGMQSVLNRLTERLAFEGRKGHVRLGTGEVRSAIESMAGGN